MLRAATSLLHLGGRWQLHTVDGLSMTPRYPHGDRLLINRYAYRERPIKRDDVIIFHPPASQGRDRVYLKRVIGLPGESIEIKRNQVFVDGRYLPEPVQTPTLCAGRWCSIVLGADELYVLGDNRVNSSDSRFWGPIHANDVIGRAVCTVWPAREVPSRFVPSHYESDSALSSRVWRRTLRRFGRPAR